MIYSPVRGAPDSPQRAPGVPLAQEVLYRKWRPRRFEDVSGQGPVTTTLRNAVANGTPAHAYLLSGPRGTGKTSTGRILAKAVNCAAPVEGEPCDQCPSCVSYDEGRAIDLIELDAASNRGIDEIRDLRESAGYAPAAGRYKVYLIDEVHMLTDAAFNALLKTLEEPPPHVIFILATTEPHKIPATILSRCQRFDLRRIPLDAVIQRLQVIAAGEGFEVDPAGFEVIAKQATGALRDAVNLLDQLVAYHGRVLTLEQVQSGLGLIVDDRAAELARAAVEKDLKAGLGILAAARDDGVEVRAFVREVVGVLRTLLLLKAGADDQLALSDAQREELNRVAAAAQVADIVAALQAFGDIDFSGDAYDALPAEIAFAALATGLQAQATAPVAAAPPMPAGRQQAPAGRGAPPARQAAPPQQRQAPAQRAAPPSAEAPQRAAPRAAEPAAEAPAQPFSPPDAGAVSAELQALRDKWSQVQTLAREKSQRFGALLGGADRAYPKSFDEGVVVIGFRFPRHAEMAREPDFNRVFTEAISEVLGQTVTVSAVEWPELADAGRAEAPTLKGGHMVEEALKQGAQRIDG